MKYICLFILLFANVCLADKQKEKSIPVDTKKLSEDSYVDPYDLGRPVDPNDIDGGEYVDPYDLPENSLEKPIEKNNPLYDLKDGLFAGSQGLLNRSEDVLRGANKSWIDWKKTNWDAPKPPIIWSQVGMEIGVGYAGAFGGSMVGVFSGFLLGSVYDSISDCEQCWVDVAISMSTLGATLGASASVYIYGNNENQAGSFTATYIGAVLPVIVGAIAYRGSRQINRSGFYLATMPLMATLAYNLTRHIRGKGEKTLFDDYFADDMWVSRDKDNILALNVRYQF